MASREGVISPIQLEKMPAPTPSEADVEEGYLRGYYASFSQNQSELHVPVNEKTRSVSTATFPPRPTGPPGGWLSEPMTRNREILFNVMICMVQIIPQACLTTCFPIIQILNRDFNISDPAVLPWVVSAYAVSFGTTILLAGRLGDIFGHKNTVILGFAWLSFWSVVTGLSRYSTYEVFFVGRAMQGLGAALMNPNALALLGRSYPPGSKAKIIAFSAFGLCAPLGAYIGMLGASILGQLAHWSWCFFLLAISSVILSLLGMLILPTPPKTPKQMLPFWDKLKQMDWLGGCAGVTGLVCVQVALISASVEGWQTQYVYMLLIIGLLLAGFFVMIELRISSEPLVPFRLLDSKVAFVLGAVACGWGTFGVWTFYLWRYLLSIRHNTPLHAVLEVFPIVPVAIIASIMTAVLMRKVKPAWTLFGALVAFTFGAMFLSLNGANSSYWAFTFVSLLITPFGMDMSFPSATFIMSNSLPQDKQGVAGSLVTTVVNYSISLGLGLASTVEVYTNDNGNNILKGIQSGWYFGTGLGALGIVICTIFVVISTMKPAAEPGKAPTPPIIEETYDTNETSSITPSVQEELRMSGIFPSSTSIATQSTRMPYQQSNTSQMPIMHSKSFSITHTDSEIMSINTDRERERDRYLLSPVSIAATYRGTWGNLEPH